MADQQKENLEEPPLPYNGTLHGECDSHEKFGPWMLAQRTVRHINQGTIKFGHNNGLQKVSENIPSVPHSVVDGSRFRSLAEVDAMDEEDQIMV
ncbi:hypothetical protein SESBI_13239 [Sesbania bispinosa]|nr:hypothetical protein SESBI_13239 [Sesbania bispinosa]